jgi:hypothetical protein
MSPASLTSGSSHGQPGTEAITTQTERFFADLHAAYARLAGDRAAWQEELDERAELDGTLADGLDEL